LSKLETNSKSNRGESSPTKNSLKKTIQLKKIRKLILIWCYSGHVLYLWSVITNKFTNLWKNWSFMSKTKKKLLWAENLNWSPIHLSSSQTKHK
jgi:hypothetical protein